MSSIIVQYKMDTIFINSEKAKYLKFIGYFFFDDALKKYKYAKASRCTSSVTNETA